MNPILRLIHFLLLGIVLSACKHTSVEDLDPVFTKRMMVQATYENQWQFPTEEGVDWQQYPAWEETFHLQYDLLRPLTPDGLRAQVSLEDGKASVFNIHPCGGEVPFTDSEQSLLFYNNNTEFIVFDALHTLKQATATTRSRSDVSRPSVIEGDGDAMNAPDMLYTHYIESFKGEDYPDATTLQVTLQPLVYSYLIQYEFSKGLEEIKQAKGSLSGMADAVSLSDQQTSSKTATLLFQAAVREFAIQALIHSFGIPDYPSAGETPVDRKYMLELDIKLKSGNVQHFRLDVTDQVGKQPRGGVIRVTGLEVDEEKAHPSYDSGFDVNVSGWGDDINITLPI